MCVQSRYPGIESHVRSQSWESSLTDLLTQLAAPPGAYDAWREGTAAHPWFSKTIYVFERRQRLVGDGC